MTRDIIPPDVLELLKAGNKIVAIKRLRVMTGLGLAEAKSTVDAFEKAHPSALHSRHAAPHSPHAARASTTFLRARSGLSPGEVAGTGGTGKWLALLAVAAIAVIAALYL